MRSRITPGDLRIEWHDNTHVMATSLERQWQRLGHIRKTASFDEALDFGGEKKNIHRLKTNSGAFRHNDNSFLGNSEPIPVVFEILAYHGPWRNFNVLIDDGAADPAAFANLHIPEQN